MSFIFFFRNFRWMRRLRAHVYSFKSCHSAERISKTRSFNKHSGLKQTNLSLFRMPDNIMFASAWATLVALMSLDQDNFNFFDIIASPS